MTDVRVIVARLKRVYRPQAVPRDPLQIILWENIGYLIDDERRAGPPAHGSSGVR